MEGKPKSEEKRRRYQKPQVKQVELRPEEAVLQGCKTVGFTAPKGLDCVGESPDPYCVEPLS